MTVSNVAEHSTDSSEAQVDPRRWGALVIFAIAPLMLVSYASTATICATGSLIIAGLVVLTPVRGGKQTTADDGAVVFG